MGVGEGRGGEVEVFIIDSSVAEWSKALVLGTSHFDGVGSNPILVPRPELTPSGLGTRLSLC